jgi:hypothetical protein
MQLVEAVRTSFAEGACRKTMRPSSCCNGFPPQWRSSHEFTDRSPSRLERAEGRPIAARVVRTAASL